MEGTAAHAVIIIPARLNSTRLPRKMLLADTGKPLVIHTWETARGSRRAATVVVATDSPEIADACARYGVPTCMTKADHPSGTDRVAEAVQLLFPNDRRPKVIVNFQGDEPELPSSAIDDLIDLLTHDTAADMATLASPIRSREQLEDPSSVKVVVDARNFALYFSRSPIPYPRRWDESLLQQTPPIFWQHVGVYAFRTECLFQFTKLRPTTLEQVESLEQLRALWHGLRIKVAFIDSHPGGIDTPEDYHRFVERWRTKYLAREIPVATPAPFDAGWASALPSG